MRKGDANFLSFPLQLPPEGGERGPVRPEPVRPPRLLHPHRRQELRPLHMPARVLRGPLQAGKFRTDDINKPKNWQYSLY